MFIGFKDLTQLQQNVDEKVLLQILSNKSIYKSVNACSRDQGKCLGSYPDENGVWRMYIYESGHKDFGITVDLWEAVVDGIKYRWEEFS